MCAYIPTKYNYSEIKKGANGMKQSEVRIYFLRALNKKSVL